MTQAAPSISDTDSNPILWQPSPARIASAKITAFIKTINQKYQLSLQNYQDLWQFSIDNREKFWDQVWDFCGIIGEKGKRILLNPDLIEQSHFFPDAKLNYAENLLRHRGPDQAIVFWGEEKIKTRLSFDDVHNQTAALHHYFKSVGLNAGDRVAGFVANMPETIVAMLATSSLGGVWSSCSPDFGVQGVLDRFGQIAPKIFVTVDGYFYKGQAIDCLAKAREIVAQMPSVEKIVVIPYVNSNPDLSGLKNAILFTDIVKNNTNTVIDFARLPFNHPLFIMFSSGTTGVPKCIVHGQGGTLIQLLKEHQLQCDVHAGDRVFYYTTCGWMMWNWLVTALASKAALLLFDGFPFQQRGRIIFDFLAAERATLFGTAAKFIDAVNKLKLDPKTTHDLSSLRTVTSTGSPLSHEGFDYIYRNIHSDVQLSSISGGTDVISCLVIGSPISPVYRGEIQVSGLGLDIAIVDEEGKKITCQKGEMVCLKSFPSMPIYFWNDPQREKYHNAYFARFDNIWCHGDYAEQTVNGGFIIYGRSDTVLKPGGVRIGTAEIYRQVEQVDEVLESIVIGQEWDNDVRVILFVKLRENIILNDDLIKKINTQIRVHASPRHVPAKIIPVADIPRTKSGKIVELAVREVIHNRPVKNIEALANPEALEHFKNLAELQSAE